MTYKKQLLAAMLVLASCQQPSTKKSDPTSTPSTKATSTSKPEPTSNMTDASKGGLLFVELLAKGDFAEAEKMFSPEMKAAVPPGGLLQIWNSLVMQGGSYQKASVTKAAQKDAFNIAIVTTEFVSLTVDLQVVFDVKGLVSGFRMVKVEPKEQPYNAPSYVKPDTYEEKALTVGEGEWALPATLTMPKGAGPFPVVILVHGSGPQDRDETVGRQKPFKDLALGLASQGVAVLRYEKRTKTHGAKMDANKITMNDETVDDAVLAVAVAEKQPSIDPKQIYVAGHSQGGLAIPRIGIKAPQTAGLIILAGPTRAFEDIILDQVNYIAGADGKVTDEEELALEQLKAAVTKVKDPTLSDKTPSLELPLNIPAAFWLDLRGYKPAEVLKGLPQRALIINGGRDYQVTKDDLDGWKSGTKGKANVTFQVFDDLNHTFVMGTGKATPAEYEQEGHVSEEVINALATWVKSK